ncbi:MAG: GDP-L-fucose synthase [Gemmatimonadota bacterium]
MHLTDPQTRIFVAGHRGLVGSAVADRLAQAGFSNLLVRTRRELDLRSQAAVQAFFQGERPQVVVLAAAKVGGILANDRYPADFLGQNLEIQNNVIGAAHAAGVERLIFLGSSCIYPKHAPQPMKEEHLLTGPLEPTNQWYAVAKIAGLMYTEALRRQHGADYWSLMPTNLYGPGDNFDLETSHVLPALIRKFHEAKGAGADGKGIDGTRGHGKDAPVTLWGTGSPRREFLYNQDLADAVVHVLQTPGERLAEVAPDGILNVGVGEDISIRELAELVRRVVGGEGEIVLDTSKPDGTPRKLLDVSRMKALGWTAPTGLEEGVRRTYEWYRRAEPEGEGERERA